MSSDTVAKTARMTANPPAQALTVNGLGMVSLTFAILMTHPAPKLGFRKKLSRTVL